MSEFIPVHRYAKLKGVSTQNVYRWIREKKFDEKDIKIENVCRDRLRISAQAKVK